MNALLMRLLIALAPVIFRVLVDIVKNLANKKVLERAVVLAQEHVRNLNKSATLTDQEKFDLAKRNLGADLKRIGLQAGDSLLNLAVELAVSVVKARATELAKQ